MNTLFTNSDYFAQQGAIYEVVSGLVLQLTDDIREGIFDDDERARSEAEELLKETEHFYDDLLTV